MSNDDPKKTQRSAKMAALALKKPRGSLRPSNAIRPNTNDEPENQVDPGNYRVEQGGKTVGILFVFRDAINTSIVYEHWYLYTGTYDYPDPHKSAELNIIPDKNIYVKNSDPRSHPSPTAFGNSTTQPLLGIVTEYIFCVNYYQPNVMIQKINHGGVYVE
jgi:hypothetical protein